MDVFGRSITEPKITMRLEGETPTALERIGALFAKNFPRLEAQVCAAIDEALSRG